MRRLSYSQISLYQSCPLKYRLQYIDGLKPKVTWHLSFGS
ncbi:MAG: PD-(D/E)XK nuclease family protein, partial [Chloroflexi bacterium]|nr:PD-(D/E)XK nuclease family protein [Chloroflexota bacterium]